MFNFNVNIPTDIHFGRGEVKSAGELMKKYADSVLMLYGSERIFKDGTGDIIVNSLEDAGCTVHKLGGVTANADTELIQSAIEMVKEKGIDGILAVGGGSCMDSAKAVSVGSCVDMDIRDYYRSPEDSGKALPIGCVVTTSATGSEANGVSVISDHDTHQKLAKFFPGSIPKFCILDPELTVSIPAFQTAAGGFDVFSHAFERFFDLRRDSILLDELTCGAMRTVVKCLPNLMKDLSNIDLRSELMFGATVAHADFVGPGGDFGCHDLSHTITKCYDLAHGEALAMIIPAWCRVMKDENPDRFRKFFSEVFGAKDIEDGISALEGFVQEIGLALKMGDKLDVDTVTMEAVNSGDPLGGGFKHLEESDIRRILEMMK